MAFTKYIADPTRKEFNRNHPVDFYEAIVSTKEKVTAFLHQSKKKKLRRLQETSWSSHTEGVRADLAVLRHDLAEVSTISSYSLSSMESLSGGNKALPGN